MVRLSLQRTYLTYVPAQPAENGTNAAHTPHDDNPRRSLRLSSRAAHVSA